jgi:hypothetical protein
MMVRGVVEKILLAGSILAMPLRTRPTIAAVVVSGLDGASTSN